MSIFFLGFCTRVDLFHFVKDINLKFECAMATETSLLHSECDLVMVHNPPDEIWSERTDYRSSCCLDQRQYLACALLS